MTAGFPDFVFNSPQDEGVLRRVFSYEAKVYDLGAYERILPGAGRRMWDMIEAERAHQKAMSPTLRRDAARRGYILP
ncbi:MAG TPA: DUF2335 domain-containing protein [Micavibrio sp.]